MKNGIISAKFLLLMTVLMFVNQTIYADKKGILKGKVLSEADGKPLEYVLIKISDASLWTTSDRNGNFSLEISQYPVNLDFRYLGKQNMQLEVKNSNFFTVRMKNDDLTLNEVAVTAKMKKKSTGSTVVLGNHAIELVQAQSMADVMQLIPGKTLSESQLHQRQNLTLRSAINLNQTNDTQGLGTFNQNSPHLINNSFGVGYLIDDIPMSNNSDLLGSRSLEYGMYNNITNFNSVGYGLDLRSIGLENIDEIEVIQGISSARYGDHSTGLIKISKKTGKTPYKVHTTIRGGSYSAQLTKGFELPKNWGHANFGVEYLRSDSDPRNGLTKFDRIRLSGKWEYLNKGKMKNIFSWSYAQTIDKENEVNTEITESTRKYENRQIRLSNKHIRYFHNSWIDRFEAIIGLDYQISDTKKTQLVNNGGEPISNSLEEGTFEVGYTPVSYYTLEQVNSVPFSLFSRLEAKKYFKWRNTKLSLTFGGTLNLEDNFGGGNEFNPDQALLQASLGTTGSGQSGWRNINFNDVVPTEVNIGTYFTSNLKGKIFGKSLHTELGVRYDNYNSKSSYSPRINTKLTWSRNFKSRIGIGFFAKAPSLQSLYRPPVYYDYLIADYRNSYYSFALAHTFVRDYTNKNIKPSKMWKYEAGIDYANKWMNASLTTYYNKQFDGFTNTTEFEIAQVPDFEFTFYPQKKPDYTQVGSKDVLLEHNIVTNDLTSINYGLELVGGIKKIKEINTSFNFSLAYRFTKVESDLPTYAKSEDPFSDVWIGFHHNTPSKYEKLNSSITATHHVSDLGLVITLTAEQFILATSSTYQRIIYPYAYYDRNLNYHEIPQEEQASDKYQSIRRKSKEATSSHISKVFANYHLKVAKQFKNGLRFSFYAINFLNHLPIVDGVNSSGEKTRIRLNRPISFGGNISFTF
jgi:hypothetical protein